jgi:hypothetical protein
MTAPNTSTGKYNAWASFLNWLTTNVPGTGSLAWSYTTFQQQENTGFPSVSVTEFMVADPGTKSMGMIVAPLNTYAGATQGKQSAMGIRIEIQDDIGQHPNAVQTIYQIRDQIKRALINAGVADDLSGAISVPCIEILDYAANNGSPADTQITGEVKDPEGMIERYIPPDTAVPNIHTIELLLRYEWLEMN